MSLGAAASRGPPGGGSIRAQAKRTTSRAAAILLSIRPANSRRAVSAAEQLHLRCQRVGLFLPARELRSLRLDHGGRGPGHELLIAELSPLAVDELAKAAHFAADARALPPDVDRVAEGHE